MIRRKRGAISSTLEHLGGWIIALFVLVLVAIGILILTGKTQGALEFFKNLLKFGGP